MAPLLLTAKQVSELTGIPESTLRKMRLNGNGPQYRKPNGRVYYTEADVREWLDGHRHKSTSEYPPR